MVILIHQLLPPLSSSFSSSSSTKTRVRFCVSSSSSSSSSSLTPMDHPHIGRGRFMEFPHLSASHRDLMVDLVSTMETRLASHLLPPSLPPDVQYYQNDTGSSQGSLHIRSGHHSSPIDFVLGNWLHCELPSGGSALDITTLSAYLNSSTDAPHFLIEFLQSSPTSLILLLDLPPRKDLVLHPDYLDTFYGDTQLDGWRQELEKVSEVRPYFSSSLYIRCIFSPAATLVRIECEVEDGSGGPGRMEEIIREHVGPTAKQILGIWLDRCTSCGDREVGEAERALLEKRDRLIKNKTVEIDLLSSLPRLFGPDVANRVMGAIQEAFKT